MAKETPILRFDHREIAVIFSLFVFVSLLMFTVGILVGKGLTQAKFEGALPRAHNPEVSHLPLTPESTAHGPTASADHSQGTHTDSHKARETASTEAAPPAEEEPLELIPQKSTNKIQTGGSLREPKSHPGVTKALTNPKVSSLIEGGDALRKKSRAALGKLPESFPAGTFTVQINSYPTEKDAQDRVESLKKTGFPHAYLTVTELGEPKKKWYRVWLGYFKDNNSAEVSGQILQERGEVKNFIVRKNETTG